MTSRFGSILGLAALLALLASVTAADAPKSPPKTKSDPVKETLHGVEIADPYRWLEDQKSPETRQWIDEQNAYTDGLLNPIAGRDKLRERITALLKIDAVGMPTQAGGRYFFAKRLASQDLSIIYLRQGLTGKDEVLIDPHPLSADKTTSVNLMSVSDDGKLLAYGIRQGGEDEVAVQLFDVDARKDTADKLPKARYFGVSINPDRSGFFYTHFGKEGPRVRFHTMGQDVAKDVEIFGKGYGPEKIISAGLSENGKHLLISVMYGSAPKKIELYHMDATAKDAPVKPVVNDIEARFSGDFAGDRLLIQTNWKAPNNRVLEANLNEPADKWKEVIPEAKSVLQGFSLVGGKMFGNYLENVTSRIRIFDLSGKALGEIPFETLGTCSGVSGRWDTQEAFYNFTSFAVPPTIFRYDAAKSTQEVWAKLNIPVDTSKIEVKQVWYESKDKTKVPMFIVHQKGLKLDGNNPTFLTGYGGFNVSRTPGFSALAALWVENGGVYALPNLRGGGEFGEDWHKAGMLDQKQNVFDDFIGAAEYLIEEKYTSAERLAIGGGSNGGLLVGAALTQRPDLFRAVVCSVPLLDMLRYHQFLVARFWVPEYGSAEDPAQFKILKAYSPYHNVKPGVKYPAVLFVTGDSDTRVDPLHARKMCALLQSATTSDRPVLLHYDTKGGHSGGKPVSKQIDDLVDELSFLFWQLGVKG